MVSVMMPRHGSLLLPAPLLTCWWSLALQHVHNVHSVNTLEGHVQAVHYSGERHTDGGEMEKGKTG